jgi:hypothetical protein
MGVDRRRIANVCVLDGRPYTPGSTVHRFEELINRQITRLHIRLRRLGPYSENSPLELVFTDFAELHLPSGSLMVGIGLVGLLAARYQEQERQDLHVIAVCSPSSFAKIKLGSKSKRRVAFYCSDDKAIAGKVADWPDVAEAYDVPFLRFGCDRHPYSLVNLIVAYLNDGDLDWEVEYIFDAPPIQIPSDTRYQAFVEACLKI